jgi:ABC-type dipeptide/oligopeptide/nickel transport system permease component
MGKINVGRVILGGLLAGLVINVFEYVLNTFVWAERSNAVFARLGLAPPGMQQITWFIVLAFLFGILLVFVYAAIRPRFGASVKTALIAGLLLWLAGLPHAISMSILGIMPSDLTIMALIAGLIELEVAAIAGARLYKEP